MRDTTVERVLVEEYKPCVLAITNSNKPWIAAVSGPASGIGAAYAQACDLMIMGESAYIYMAFAAIALVPDGGNTWQMVRQLGYRRAFEAIIEGQKIPAAQAVEWGLSNKMAPDESLQQEARDWAAGWRRRRRFRSVTSRRSCAPPWIRIGGDHRSESVRQNECIGSKDLPRVCLAFFEKRSPPSRALTAPRCQRRRDTWISPALGAARSPCRPQHR